MASKGLGTLTLDLIARIGGFERGMDKAARHADRRMREIEKRAKQFGAVLATGLVAAGTGLAVALGRSIDKMDELRDQSIRLGIGIETLSAFSFAAKQTGTDIEALGTGFKILAKNMADALNPDSGKAQIFESLGIQVTDATGKLKQFEQIIPEIADKFAQLEDGTTKAALAQELFGKSGLNLIEFLNQGGDGIQELTDKARELGIVIDQETADKADAFKDTLGELKAAGEGLTAQLAAQLLPKLLELAQWATEFVSDGNNAKRAAEGIAEGFDILVTAADFVVKSLRTVNATVRGVTSDITALILTLRAADNARSFQFGDAMELMEQAKLARQMAAEQSADIEKIWTAAAGPKDKSLFGRVQGSFRGPDTIDRNALNRALGGVKDKPAKKKKEGKSDEEKEAERLKAAYDSLNASLSERVALFGEESEAVKLRYELEHGELSKVTEAMAAKLGIDKQALIALAETLDLKREEAELYKKSEEAAKKEAEEKRRGVEATAQLIDDMRFELDLMGLTNKEREKAIALRYADVNATDEQRAAIAALSDQIYQAREVAEFWDHFQDTLADSFVDLATGAKSLKDVVKDFFDSIAQYILRSIAENWAEKISKIFMANTTGSGASAGGSNAGFWGSLISAFFGGGKATGGPVSAGMFYRVNENGPELLTVGGNDYLMMGNRGGVVTPNAAMGGGAGVTQTNIFNYAAPYDARVEAQKNARTAFETNRALSRNR